nr:MAG TPA: hypothetical protein [Caudoviricetes sp.]DAV65491.1 MAG TPA: hypothetical protein [Caudoviricetes sp.]
MSIIFLIFATFLLDSLHICEYNKIQKGVLS